MLSFVAKKKREKKMNKFHQLPYEI